MLLPPCAASHTAGAGCFVALPCCIQRPYGKRAAPVIAPCLRQGEKWVQKHDRSSLRVLGSVGEPINPRAWQWLFEARRMGRAGGFHMQ